MYVTFTCLFSGMYGTFTCIFSGMYVTFTCIFSGMYVTFSILFQRSGLAINRNLLLFDIVYIAYQFKNRFICSATNTEIGLNELVISH